MKSVLIILSVFVAICVAEEDITRAVPKYDKPWVPAPGFNRSDHTGWKHRHDHLLKQTEEHKDNVTVVFLGDSKTYYWLEPGKDVWEHHFVPRGAYNYGIRGDSTRQILWRIEHKELDGLKPKLLVFMSGGNNMKDNYNRGTDEEIAKAYEVILEKLGEKLPNTTILFVGQLPRPGVSTKRSKEIDRLMINHFEKAQYSNVHWVQIYDKFLLSDGKQNKQLFVEDHFHLSNEGYKLFAEILEPHIKKLLGED